MIAAMPPIRQLDASLVNKIAAGEVIERPGSVVKELIENSIDAGAARIDVALEEGGTRLIRVTDDGCGIGREDLALAVAPHATSKIATDEDLFNIRTLGFRGEALASIGAVSHLRICSRLPDRIEAYELISAPPSPVTGQPADPPRPLPLPRACAAPPGTTVEVRNLFHNVPARRKFLRHASTEFSHATEQVARLALAHPQIAFSLAHNGRAARRLPPTTERRTRIGDFYGFELAECLISVQRQEQGLHVEALFAPPAQSRASTKWQYVFLNGRFIADRRIAYAIREAFRGLLEPDRFPVVFLFLTAPPDAYDVNVHPTKIEVRWRDAGLVQSQVLAVLREALLSHDLTPRLSFARPPAGGPTAGGPTAADAARQEGARRAIADYLKSVDPTQARLEFRPPRFPVGGVRPSLAGDWGSGSAAPGHSVSDQPPSERPPVFPPNPPASATAADAGPAVSAAQAADAASPPAGEAFGPGSPPVLQVHNTYLVAQTEEGILIVDQHALHERILYEQFRRRILQGPLEGQGLLIPQPLECSPAQAQAAETHRELLRRLGIELAAFGPRTLAVQTFPTLLQQVDPAAFTRDLLDKLAESDEAASAEGLLHAALDMMACKAAVKAGDPLTLEEMQTLLAHRHLTERSSNCPHGRPTSLQLSTQDLERQFRRS